MSTSCKEAVAEPYLHSDKEEASKPTGATAIVSEGRRSYINRKAGASAHIDIFKSVPTALISLRWFYSAQLVPGL